MKIKNIEFKAKVNSFEEYEHKLLKLNPAHFGTDQQVDTYYETKKGRLKLREIAGKKNKLIDYDRENAYGTKMSAIIFYKHEPSEPLKEILSNQLGIQVIVSKTRTTYGIENVKFHFDVVQNLGSFIEVEASDEDEALTVEDLKKQCAYFYDYFEIQPEQVEKLSYSELLLKTLEMTKYRKN